MESSALFVPSYPAREPLELGRFAAVQQLANDLVAAMQSKFDQINIMTYDLSGPWGGWITWFNSAIYHGGQKFPTVNRYVPSVAESVSNFIAGGVSPAKLGIGIAFYGYTWSGGAGTSTGGAASVNDAASD